MDIFLCNILMNCYKELCMEDGIFEDEEWSLTDPTTGLIISDYDYVKKNGLIIYDDILFNEVYTYLKQIANPNEDKFSLINILKHLIENYLTYNKKNKNCKEMIFILKNSLLEDIKNKFFLDKNFGIELIRNNFYRISNED